MDRQRIIDLLGRGDQEPDVQAFDKKVKGWTKKKEDQVGNLMMELLTGYKPGQIIVPSGPTSPTE